MVSKSRRNSGRKTPTIYKNLTSNVYIFISKGKNQNRFDFIPLLNYLNTKHLKFVFYKFILISLKYTFIF